MTYMIGKLAAGVCKLAELFTHPDHPVRFVSHCSEMCVRFSFCVWYFACLVLGLGVTMYTDVFPYLLPFCFFLATPVNAMWQNMTTNNKCNDLQ